MTTQTEFEKQIADRAGLPVKTVHAVLNAAADALKQALIDGEDVSFHREIGKFKFAKTAARTGRNPQTGEALDIPAHGTVKFKPALGLKQAIE